MALKNLTENDINWIANEHKNGRSFDEIAVDTGMSTQNVKRALAEAGVFSLSWYKTKNEQDMLDSLQSIGITNDKELCKFIEDYYNSPYL